MRHEVTTLDELATLDSDECVAGYNAGRKNVADFTQRSKSYWHGYLNGLVDGGHAHPSEAQRKLIQACRADPSRGPFVRVFQRAA